MKAQTTIPLKASAFKSWMQRVNAYLVRFCGMSADDLPDAPYWDWFDEGMYPKHAAHAAIKRASLYS